MVSRGVILVAAHIVGKELREGHSYHHLREYFNALPQASYDP
jgi:hypothetical protein